VSPIAGTTRDTIDVQLDLDGIPITLTDTAGLRDSADEIEQIGIDRTHNSVRDADIVLALSSHDTPPICLPDVNQDSHIIRVHTKSDLCSVNSTRPDTHYISAVTGDGIDSLIQGIVSRLLDDDSGKGSDSLIAINARHSALITLAIEALNRVLIASSARVPADLIAVELHDAAFHLACISGRNVIEAMHTEIFSRFCIGK
jgi:tRNA modification GTPase